MQMAKKELSPEQYREKLEKKAIKAEKFAKTFISVLALLLSLVIAFGVVFSAYNFAGSIKGNRVVINSGVQQNSDNSDSMVQDDSMDYTDESISDVGEDDTVPENDEGTVVPEGTEEEKQESGFATTAEIVEYFNQCANKVKTDATKVVKIIETTIHLV